MREVISNFGLSPSEFTADFEQAQAQARPQCAYRPQTHGRSERRGFEAASSCHIDEKCGGVESADYRPSPSEATADLSQLPSEAMACATDRTICSMRDPGRGDGAAHPATTLLLFAPANGADLLPPPRLHIIGAVALFWVVSLSMVFATKALVGSASVPSTPMFVSWFQCIIPSVFCYIAPKAGVSSVPAWEVRRDLLIQAIPLSVVFTGMILLKNLCLRFVELSFYSVALSLTVVCSIPLNFILLGERTSLRAIACCGIVVAGFFLGSQQELRWSLVGGLFGVGSSIFSALQAIFVKKMLPLVDNNPWKLIRYNHLLASFLFLPIIAVSGEVPIILHTPALRTPKFWAMIVGIGLMSVGIAFAIANQIKFTSPLTHSVSATAKSAAQTIIALAVYQNPITLLGGLSVAIILIGSLAYTLVRQSEMHRHAAEESNFASERQPLLIKA